jgi:hypothetical protein
LLELLLAVEEAERRWGRFIDLIEITWPEPEARHDWDAAAAVYDAAARGRGSHRPRTPRQLFLN